MGCIGGLDDKVSDWWIFGRRDVEVPLRWVLITQMTAKHVGGIAMAFVASAWSVSGLYEMREMNVLLFFVMKF